jgi:hypothetical protein
MEKCFIALNAEPVRIMYYTRMSGTFRRENKSRLS